MRLMLLGLFLLVGGDAFTDGVRAYREGRYRDALRAFSAASEAAGEQASAELLHNQALAALGAGDLLTAEIAAEKAAARGDARFRSFRDFLLGNTAFARCERSTRLARLPESGPPAFDEAIAHAEASRHHWQRAAASRENWPEACRNIERALIRIEMLKKRREEAVKKSRASRRRRPPPPPDPDPGAGAGTPERVEGQATALLTELSPAQVRNLFEKLQEKEQEKRRLRRSRRRSGPSGGRRDW